MAQYFDDAAIITPALEQGVGKKMQEIKSLQQTISWWTIGIV